MRGGGFSEVFQGDAGPAPARQEPAPAKAGVTYPLEEVCLLAVLAGAETFVDIARFGTKKLDLLRRFRPFRGKMLLARRAAGGK